MTGKQRIAACLVIVGSTLVAASTPALAQKAAATTAEQVWEGVLSAGGVDLTLVVHIKTAADGTRTAMFDSPNQGATGLKVDSVTLDKSRLSFEMKDIMAKFEGKLDAKGAQAVGTWSQGPATTPLTLRRKSEAELAASKIVGKDEVWQGKLAVGGAELTLVLRIGKTAAGDLVASFASPDQNPGAIKVDSVAKDKTTLDFEVKVIRGRFQGKLDAKGLEAVGKFTQNGVETPLTLKKQTDAEVDAAKVVGKEDVWEGKLEVGAGNDLRVVLHVRKTAGGGYTATFDSPDQGTNGLKVDTISLDKTTMKFELKLVQGSYEGKLHPSGDSWVGFWTQGGETLPLTLKKVDKPAETRRSQTPRAPFPYKSENVGYVNRDGGVSLAGTLTTPDGLGPFPAVILISGSGAQDRDETILGHKPFLVIADSLTRRGIAVLRVDDRGVGGSTGTVMASTSEDFAGDVLAGLKFLKTRPAIDAKRLGLIGHSEGGIIAPMVASRSADVAFVVLMAGTGLPGDVILRMQAKLIYEALGTKGEKLTKALADQDKLIKIAMTEKDDKAATRSMKAVMDEAKANATEKERKAIDAADKVLEAQLAGLRSPWFRFFLSYDPRPTLAKVRCPVLALVGEKDMQVPPKENLAEIAKVLKKAGNTRAEVRELPGLNHLFQTCKTGSPSEYARIDETVAPSALRLMGDWIATQVKTR